MADETTDMADRAELSIFIWYVDSDNHKVKEEFLAFVEVVGSWGIVQINLWSSTGQRSRNKPKCNSTDLMVPRPWVERLVGFNINFVIWFHTQSISIAGITDLR